MSPVSRGRRPKKQGKSQQRTKRSASSPGSGRVNAAEPRLSGLSIGRRPSIDAFFGLPDRPEWFTPSQERVLAASRGLLAARGPRALEQATAELIGAELHRAMRAERSGLRFDLWATELTGRAVDRMADAAGRGNGAWQGPWRLLHGLASIGSYGLGAFASQQASEAAKKLPPDGLAAQPAWLELLPDITATGDVWVMQDAYGTRSAVIAGFGYPGGIEPSVYLFDIDACGTIRLAGAGMFDDVKQAAAAWREQVGVSAEGQVPVPATAGSLTCLVYCEQAEQILSGSEPQALMDNWFRGPRRMRDVTDALRGQGVDLPSPRPLYRDIDFAPMAGEFTGWFSVRFGHAPSRDAVEALAAVWLEGMLPGSEHAVSPHRSQFYRELIGDWRDDPVTQAALALLPEWVRWNGEQAGVPAHLSERAVSAAST
jgi:hypothetical protein